jgi:peptide methionine sulfoxide reductase msrA/msrB
MTLPAIRRSLVFAFAGTVFLAACTRSGDPAPAPKMAAEPATAAAPEKAEPMPSALSERKFAKPSEAELRKKLSPMQYRVTQQADTEPPFANQYWNNHEDGLYVDSVTGEPLFSSRDKFESGTGWPSFTRPVDPSRVVNHSDDTLGMARTEVRSRDGNSHLGHVFEDGPEPTGLRYCINSAALRFIPVNQLAAEGYGEYLGLFADKPAAAK